MLSAPAATDNARLATSSDLPTLGSPPTNRMPCGGNNPRLHQARRRSSGLLLKQLTQRQHRPGVGFHSSASVVASNRIDSSMRAALRAAARRTAVRASLLTLRKMPFVVLI